MIDGYVSLEGAHRDYGVVVHAIDAEIDEYDLDESATERARTEIRANRAAWLEAEPEEIAQRYRRGELSMFDLVRRYGVVVDWGTGELFPNTTRQFREMLRQRTVRHW